MVKVEGPGKRLRVYVGESDHRHGRPPYQAIVEMLRREGIAGATVARGVEGYGARSRIHTARILRVSEDLPVVVEAIDRAERIEAVLPKLDEMVQEGLITPADVEVIRYRPEPAAGSGGEEEP